MIEAKECNIIVFLMQV